MEFDITPIVTEIFKTQAYIKAYAKTTLNEEQMFEFKKNYLMELRESINAFIDHNPERFNGLKKLFDDADE